jgi:hypothetical protein
MQIGGENIEILLVDMVLEKNFNTTQIWKDTFPCLFTWEWAKQFKFGTFQVTTYD